MNEIPEFNFKQTGGEFNCKVRLLQTFTVHLNDATGRYIVRDDRNAGKIVSAGWATIEKAAAAHQWEDDKRTWS